MYEVKQAAVVRAIEILRSGPMTAATFAARMWPDRDRDESQGRQSQAGHAFLRRIGVLGYVEKIGEMWVIRSVSANGTAVSSAVGSAVGSADPFAVGLPDGLPNHP